MACGSDVVDSVAPNMRYVASKHFNYIAATVDLRAITSSAAVSLAIVASVFPLHMNVLRTLDRQTQLLNLGWT